MRAYLFCSYLLVSGAVVLAGEPWMQRPPPIMTPIISPRHHLALCTIPKVACTAWRQLMRRIAGHTDYASADRGAAHHSNGHISGLQFLSDLDPGAARAYMARPATVKAALVRNPMVRILSAYRDKCEVGFARTGFKFPQCRDTFEEFTRSLTGSCQGDGHFIPQICFCGLDTTFKGMYRTYHMEDQQSELVSVLIENGVPRTKFSNGWGSKGNANFLKPENAQHFTGADSRVAEYYTSIALFDHVQKIFAKDIYALGYSSQVATMRNELFGKGVAAFDVPSPLPVLQKQTKLLAVLCQGGEPENAIAKRNLQALSAPFIDIYFLNWGPESDGFASVHCPGCIHSEGINILMKLAQDQANYTYFMYLDDDMALTSLTNSSVAEVLRESLETLQPLLASPLYENMSQPEWTWLWQNNDNSGAVPARSSMDAGGTIFHHSLATFLPFPVQGAFGIWQQLRFTALELRPHKVMMFRGFKYRNQRSFNMATASEAERQVHRRASATEAVQRYTAILKEPYLKRFAQFNEFLNADGFRCLSPSGSIDFEPLQAVTFEELESLWHWDSPAMVLRRQQRPNAKQCP